MKRLDLIIAVFRLASAFVYITASSKPVHATSVPAPGSYVGYVLGVHAFDLTFAVSLEPAAYHVAVSFRLAGVLGALWPAEGNTAVDGSLTNNKPEPREMLSQGRYWGTAHMLRVTWKNGRPIIVQMSPPAEAEREPVPLRDQANTLDTLSAVVALIQQIAAIGRCDMSLHTYDGSRLSELASRTLGEEVLKPTGRSTFQGPALRCELAGRMIGGFVRGDKSPESRRTKTATIWFARVHPREPPIPVRMVFQQQGSPGATACLAP